MTHEEKVEQRAKAVHRLAWPWADPWDKASVGAKESFRTIARAELEREGKLVTMLKQLLPVLTANGCPAWRARAEEVLAVYESEFAPPKRTLAQVAADVDRNMRGHIPCCTHIDGKAFFMIPVELGNELAAVLAARGECG